MEQSFDRSGDGSGAESSLDSKRNQPPIHASNVNVDVKDSSQIELPMGGFSKSVSPYIGLMTTLGFQAHSLDSFETQPHQCSVEVGCSLQVARTVVGNMPLCKNRS